MPPEQAKGNTAGTGFVSSLRLNAHAALPSECRAGPLELSIQLYHSRYGRLRFGANATAL
jgi:hypothetical protein